MKEERMEEKKELVFDPKEIKKGTCHIRKWGERKVSICRDDDNTIKIYEVEKEE